MPIDRVVIVGAGGHAKVVIGAAQQLGIAELRIVDDSPSRIGHLHCGFVVSSRDRLDGGETWPFHVAIGNAETRRSVFEGMLNKGGAAATLAHPGAYVAGSASIGPGSFMAAGSIVGPDADLGRSVIVNHNAVVDHDCIVGDFTHVAPGAILGGNVRVGHDVLIGAGATVLPGIHIGDGAVIAAGSTVVRNVQPGEKVIYSLVRKC